MISINIKNDKIPPEIFSRYKFYLQNSSSWKCWEELSEKEIWYNLVFCILSSNVSSELAISTLQHLWQKNLLQLDWLATECSAFLVLSNELSKPLYHPRRANGSLRKYRFPRNRARDIVNAAKVIHNKPIIFKKIFEEVNDEKTQRNFIMSNIPGLGYKQSTHFLRNIGFSNSLAIIDTHIISFFELISDPPIERPKNISPNIYKEYEELFCNLSKNLNLEPFLLDYAIWDYMKGRIKR